jgi:hypothetical protein
MESIQDFSLFLGDLSCDFPGDIGYWATDLLEMDEAKREKMGRYS